MIRPFLGDPLFEGIPRPGLTGSRGLTDITFAGQRHVMPLRGLVGKATGPDGISQREEREMAKREARVVKKADEKIWTARARAGQVRTHGFESSTRLLKLAGQELAFGERPAMDGNRRP